MLTSDAFWVFYDCMLNICHCLIFWHFADHTINWFIQKIVQYKSSKIIILSFLSLLKWIRVICLCVCRGGYLGLHGVFQSDNLSIHEVMLLQPSSCTAVNIDRRPPPGTWLWNMRNGRRGGRKMNRKIDRVSLKRRPDVKDHGEILLLVYKSNACLW